MYDHIGSGLLETSVVWLDWIIQVPGSHWMNLESSLVLIYSFLGENTYIRLYYAKPSNVAF